MLAEVELSGPGAGRAVRLWRWKRRGDSARPEGMSDKQRLEQLLYQLADDIAAAGDDQIDLHWSREVRAYAGQIRAGQAWGLRNFLGLFGSDPRNAINDQPFARTRTFDEAHRLAT